MLPISLSRLIFICVFISTVRPACTPAASGGGGGGSTGKCSQYMLINARGTMEIPHSQSMAYRAVNAKIMGQVSGGQVYNVNYAASIMQNSGGGTSDIVNKIKSTHASNPNMCFFLEGYSQGAAAVMFSLPKLTEYYDVIRGISVVGNPLAGVQAMMGGSAEHTKFKCKTFEMCAAADPVCLKPTGGAGAMSHVDYIFNPGDHSKITKFAVEALTTGIQKCGGAGGGGAALSPGGGGSGGSGGLSSSLLKKVPVIGSFLGRREYDPSLYDMSISQRRHWLELEQEWQEIELQKRLAPKLPFPKLPGLPLPKLPGLGGGGSSGGGGGGLMPKLPGIGSLLGGMGGGGGPGGMIGKLMGGGAAKDASATPAPASTPASTAPVSAPAADAGKAGGKGGLLGKLLGGKKGGAAAADTSTAATTGKKGIKDKVLGKIPGVGSAMSFFNDPAPLGTIVKAPPKPPKAPKAGKGAAPASNPPTAAAPAATTPKARDLVRDPSISTTSLRSDTPHRLSIRRHHRKMQLIRRQEEIEAEMEMMKRLQVPSISSLIGGGKKDAASGGGGGGIAGALKKKLLGKVPIIGGMLAGGSSGGGGSASKGGGLSSLMGMMGGGGGGLSSIMSMIPGLGGGGGGASSAAGAETCAS